MLPSPDTLLVTFSVHFLAAKYEVWGGRVSFNSHMPPPPHTHTHTQDIWSRTHLYLHSLHGVFCAGNETNSRPPNSLPQQMNRYWDLYMFTAIYIELIILWPYVQCCPVLCHC